MKNIIFIFFLLSSGTIFSQWVAKTDTVTIDEFISLGDWIHLDGGLEIDCSRVYNSSDIRTTYYKRSDRTDLVFCRAENLMDGSYDLFFYRLKYDQQNRLCWIRDLLGMSFNKENELQKFLFFDENGEVCEPQPFTLSEK